MLHPGTATGSHYDYIFSLLASAIYSATLMLFVIGLTRSAVALSSTPLLVHKMSPRAPVRAGKDQKVSGSATLAESRSGLTRIRQTPALIAKGEHEEDAVVRRRLRECIVKYLKKKLQRVSISKLRPHPRQAMLFAACSEEVTKALAASMDEEGQNEPVEILPDHTIICGHQRVQAAKMLGWKQVLCWVRDDLAEAGDDAVEKRLIEDNMLRRQLTRLGYARCYRRLKELGRDGWAGREHAKQDFRDHIGTRFGVEGRTLDRWASILRAPMPIQCAFDDKLLAEASAIKIATKLDDELQAEVAAKIKSAREKGGTAKETRQRIAKIVENYFPRNDRPEEQYTIWSRLRKSLETAIRDFDGQAPQIAFAIARPDRDLLHDAIGLLRYLRRAGREKEKESNDTIQRYLDRHQTDEDLDNDST